MVEPFASDRLRRVLGSSAHSLSSASDRSFPLAFQPYSQTADSPPRKGAATHPVSTLALALDERRALLDALEPSPVPSDTLAAAMRECAECATARRDSRPRAATTAPAATAAPARCAEHEARWRDERWRSELARHGRGERFAAGYAEFRDRTLESPAVAASFLATIREQAAALAVVWQAHLCGALTLPPTVAKAVQGALTTGR